MSSKFQLFILLVVNLYYPISPILVMGINMLFLFFYNTSKISKDDLFLLITSLLLLMILGVAASQTSFVIENDVVFKYIRNVLAAVLLIPISRKIMVDSKDFVWVLAIVLMLHPIAIILQLIYPPLGVIMAPYLNFHRDVDVINQMMVRKMGMTGGYDTAALVLIMFETLFFYFFYYKRKIIYLIVSVLSVGLTLVVSRLGMVMGILLLGYFTLQMLKSKGKIRVIGVVLMCLFMMVVMNVMLPILANTNVLSLDMENSSDKLMFFMQDYISANGTLEGLTHKHLYVIDELNAFEKIFGAATSPNSDIGYVQMIFHVGIIGVLLIMLMHLFFLYRLFKLKFDSPSLNVLKHFMIIYVLVLFVFNYKLLIMQSRGFYDFVIIGIVYLEIQGSYARRRRNVYAV